MPMAAPATPVKQRLEFYLQPKQDRLLELVKNGRATWIGFGGSRGAAKSGGGRRILLIRRFLIPNTRGCILRRTYDLVRENHIEPMFREYPFLRQFYRAGDKDLALPNGSVLSFRYAENTYDVDAMIGKEYYDFLVDQAEAFTESELNTMKSCTRWPGVPDTACKYVLTFNPGGVGSAFLKRVFYDKQYRGKEVENDYTFIQAYGWDNVEWAKSSLESDGLPPFCGPTANCGKCAVCSFYRWDSDKRFDYFITRTQYGRELNALPAALRIGWLLGSFDHFPRQYFDIWSEERFVRPCAPEPWQPCWIGIDWGFAHPSAIYWAAQLTPKVTGVYRELSPKGLSPKALAQEIVEHTPEEERPYVKAIGLSHDAFSVREGRDSIAAQMAEVFHQARLPYPVKAGKDVAGVAARTYEMFRQDELVIDPSCRDLIRVLPMISRREDEPEATEKFEGDDPFDGLKHCLQARLGFKDEPQELRVRSEAQGIGDPLARWFYLTKHRPEKPPAAINVPNIPPWMSAGNA
jgi:hypothetical protein